MLSQRVTVKAQLLQQQGYTYVQGEAVARVSQEEVLIVDDIKQFLKTMKINKKLFFLKFIAFS